MSARTRRDTRLERVQRKYDRDMRVVRERAALREIGHLIGTGVTETRRMGDGIEFSQALRIIWEAAYEAAELPVDAELAFTWLPDAERKKVKRGPIPAETRLAVYKRDGYRCVVCGTSDNLTLDHRIPLARGGTDAVSNLQTMCSTHNEEKDDQ